MEFLCLCKNKNREELLSAYNICAEGTSSRKHNVPWKDTRSYADSIAF